MLATGCVGSSLLVHLFSLSLPLPIPPTSFYGLVQSGCFQVHLAVVSCVSTMKLFSTTPWRLQVLIFIQGEMTYIFQLGISTQRVKAVCSQSFGQLEPKTVCLQSSCSPGQQQLTSFVLERIMQWRQAEVTIFL